MLQKKIFNLFIQLFIFLKSLSLLLATLVKNKSPTSDGFVRETDHETPVHVHPLWPCFLPNSTPDIFVLPSCPFALKFFVFPAVNLHHWLTLNLKERRKKTNKTEENRHYWSRWKLTQNKVVWLVGGVLDGKRIHCANALFATDIQGRKF